MYMFHFQSVPKLFHGNLKIFITRFHIDKLLFAFFSKELFISIFRIQTREFANKWLVAFLVISLICSSQK